MLLLWSGGADSTCALHRFLADGVSVRTLAIRHGQVGAAEESRLARQAIIEQLGAMGYTFAHTEVSFRQTGKFDANPSKGGLIQPILWLSVAVQYLEADEDLALGYIRGDDIWRHRQEMEEAFYALQDLAYREGNLTYPVEHFYKWEVVQALQQNQLNKHIWYCEEPVSKGKVCGKCKPCLAHQTALWQLKSGLVANKPKPTKARLSRRAKLHRRRKATDDKCESG